MALSQRLQLRQSHALVMTPQLMQAIKLLQLSNLDLAAYVEGGARAQSAARPQRRERQPAPEPERTADALPASEASADWNEQDRETGRQRRRTAPRRRRRPMTPSAPRPRAAEGPAGYSEWAGVGPGGRDDGDYNLEAFVSAETTLADHLAEQLVLAIADPVRRMIGQYLIDLVDEAGYLSGDLAAVGGKARRAARRSRGGARHPAGLRSARRVRAQSHRMPGDPAQGARPLRSRDAGAGRRISICWPGATSRP